jgi:metal-responsive CopG/Arc/MetJ family transcriptional regulator
MKNKIKRKIKIYFSMNPDLYESFEKHIDKNLLDKSKVIEKLIEEYMKNN